MRSLAIRTFLLGCCNFLGAIASPLFAFDSDEDRLDKMVWVDTPYMSASIWAQNQNDLEATGYDEAMWWFAKPRLLFTQGLDVFYEYGVFDFGHSFDKPFTISCEIDTGKTGTYRYEWTASANENNAYYFRVPFIAVEGFPTMGGLGSYTLKTTVSCSGYDPVTVPLDFQVDAISYASSGGRDTIAMALGDAYDLEAMAGIDFPQGEYGTSGNKWFASLLDPKDVSPTGFFAQSGLCGKGQTSVLDMRVFNPYRLTFSTGVTGGTLEFVSGINANYQQRTMICESGTYSILVGTNGAEWVRWVFTRGDSEYRLDDACYAALGKLEFELLCHVSFDSNGGTSTCSDIWAVQGKPFDSVEPFPEEGPAPPEPVKDSRGCILKTYEFDGWWYADDEHVTGASITPDLPYVTLFARWKEDVKPKPVCPCDEAFLNIGRTSLEFDCEGGSVTYKVESSTNWTSTITSPDGSVASTLTATAGEDGHTISVGKNDTGKERSWIIHYDNGCMTAEVKITQKACPDPDCPCTIDVGASSIVFDDCKADSKRISVTSSGGWSSSVNGGPGLSVTSAGSKGEVLLSVTENTTGKLREWDIVFTGHSECGDECSKTVHVTQMACNEDPTEDKCFVFADTARIAIDGCGSATRKVEINASSNWTSRVEGGPGLNVTPSGKGGTATAVFNIDEGAPCSTREWTVVFTLVGSECGEVSTSVDVVQTCGCGCQISVVPSRRTVGPGISAGLVSVTSSHAWTIDWHSVPSWVVPLVGAGDPGTTVVPYLVRKQPSCDDGAATAAREAKVRFVSGEGCSDVFDLVQESRECCTYLDISHAGEEIRTFVTNNAAFSLPLAIRSSSVWKVASLPQWITVGVEDHKANVLTLNASANPEVERSGEVRLTNASGNVRDLMVVQTKETFTVEPGRVFLPGTAGETILSVSGTSGWTLTIPDEAKSWLSAQRESPGDSTVTLALRENATGEIRETELVFSCGLITKEVTVVQDSPGMRLAIVGEPALQGEESTALKCYLVQPGGGAKEILPDWSVEGPDEVSVDEAGTLRVEGTLLAETVVTVTARYEQGGRTFSARHEVTIVPKIGPGVWTHDVAAARAAAKADGKLIAVLASKPDSCPHCREFESVAFNPEFLKWAHDNKVYLIQAVRSGPCDESLTDAYFWALAESLGKAGSVALPALAFAYPEAQDIGVGLDCARVGEKIGTAEYDGSLQALIEGVASYLKPDEPAKTFAEALGVPELECVPWGSTKDWQLRIDPDWTCDGNGSGMVGNNLREWTATPGFSFKVTGPTQMKFSYSKSFSRATFSVDCAAGILYRDDTPGEKTDWKQVVVDIPAGDQTVYFKVRLGDAALHLNEEYDYNGFWVDDLQFGEFEHDRPTPAGTHTVTFDLGRHGRRTGGGELTQTVGDGGVAVVPTFDVDDGWKFIGWDKRIEGVLVTSDMTVTALYEQELEAGLYLPEADAAFTGDVATTYDGYLYDVFGGIEGAIQVKAAKAKYSKKTGRTTTKLTIGIQLRGVAKKISISGEYDLGRGGEQTFAAKGSSVTLALGANGLTGSFGGCTIEGVANVFALKDAASKAAASAADAAYVGSYNVFSEDGAFTVTVAKKGKAKLSGTFSDGTKVSASAQLLVGTSVACAPFVVAKKGLAFVVWFGEETTVAGLMDAVVGRGGDLEGTNVFYADADALSDAMSRSGVKVLADFAPYAVPVASNGKKWTVANGAKAGKIKYDAASGSAWDEKTSRNPAGLALAYSAKTGTFAGSFKVYGVVNGKLKTYTAKVTGVLVNGRGYGYAIVSKVGGAKVWIDLEH